MGCKSNQTLKNSLSIKNHNIIVYQLNSSKIKEQEFNSIHIPKKYIIRKLILSNKEKLTLIKELLNNKNYEPIDRKCESIPVFAIEYKDSIMAVLDVEYCPFVKMINKEGNQTTLQLKMDNKLKKVLLNEDKK